MIRHVPSAAALLLSLPLLLCATIPEVPVRQGEGFLVHRGDYVPTVRRERERAMLAAYRAADAEGRAAAETILRAGRQPGAPELQPPDLAVIASAGRALEGSSGIRGLQTWREFADSIDLRVVPGAFEAREEGRGERTTVHVTSLWKVGIAGKPEVVLWWVSPEGEEIRARGETVETRHFENGFEMYVRPPASKAGRWRLLAELHTPEGVVRSGGVPVDCVDRLAERRAALATDVPSFLVPVKASLSARLGPLLSHGVRSADALSLEEWFALAAGEAKEPPVRPVVLPGFEALWELAPRAAEPSTAGVLILTSKDEHPTDLLVGARREAWSDFQERTGRRVLAATLPRPRSVGPDAARFFDHLRGRLGIEDLVVVARGENGLLLPHSLKLGDDHGVDGLVLAATPAARVAPRRPLGIPQLLVDSGASGNGRESGTGPAGGLWTRVARTAPALIVSLELPELIAEWLDES